MRYYESKVATLEEGSLSDAKSMLSSGFPTALNYLTFYQTVDYDRPKIFCFISSFDSVFRMEDEFISGIYELHSCLIPPMQRSLLRLKQAPPYMFIRVNWECKITCMY